MRWASILGAVVAFGVGAPSASAAGITLKPYVVSATSEPKHVWEFGCKKCQPGKKATLRATIKSGKQTIDLVGSPGKGASAVMKTGASSPNGKRMYIALNKTGKARVKKAKKLTGVKVTVRYGKSSGSGKLAIRREFNPCSLLTQAEVDDAAGQVMKPGQYPKSDVNDGRTCAWETLSGGGAFQLNVEEGFSITYRKLKLSDFDDSEDPDAGFPPAPTPVPDVGDIAFFVHATDRPKVNLLGQNDDRRALMAFSFPVPGVNPDKWPNLMKLAFARAKAIAK